MRRNANKKNKKLNVICVLVCIAIIFYLFIPRKEVGLVSDIFYVSSNGQEITDRFNSLTLSLLSSELSNTSCMRFKNPIDVYPLQKDTIIIECRDNTNKTHRFVFIGSQGRFSVNSHNIYAGKSKFDEIVRILGISNF